jgi:hypothetical protein
MFPSCHIATVKMGSLVQAHMKILLNTALQSLDTKSIKKQISIDCACVQESKPLFPMYLK